MKMVDYSVLKALMMNHEPIEVIDVRSNQMSHFGHPQAKRSRVADLARLEGGHVQVREPAVQQA